MSEYQYYQFTAIDRPLTREEMEELRSRSTRATITPTSFINEYNWGDLKGDPIDWMRRYFDAFVYFANWGNYRFALRLPRSAINKPELKPFFAEGVLNIEETGSHWIIEWNLNESGGYEYFDADGGSWMRRLVPLRDELLRGDLRSLYLGWLAGVSSDEIDEEDVLEPPVPPGMAQLSGAQQALVEFLDIDPDLVAAAAVGSAALAKVKDDKSLDTWLKALAVDEMRVVLKLLLQGESQAAERQLKSRFLAWQKEHTPGSAPSRARRKVGELRAIAEEQEELRLQREAKEQEREAAKAKKKRDAYLTTLAADFDRHWQAAEQCAQRANASGYDEAARTIADLAEAYVLTSSRDAFERALKEFMGRHGKRTALVRRLLQAGVWEK